jgi:pimeloyl-ACP methyl ester carboxylesterase
MLRSADSGVGQSLVIVPGWGFDGRVFAELDWPCEWRVADGDSILNPTDRVEHVVGGLQTERVSLLGWSMGGFAVCAFAGRHPELVDEVILVGMRRKYDKGELAEMRRNLEKNRAACLRQFYRRCFAKEEMARYQWFKGTLLEHYLETLSAERLVRELDWLGQAEMRPEDLGGIETIRFVHGTSDAIAPIEEAMELVDSIPQGRLITFEQTGHLPFLRDDFMRCVYED